MLFANHKETRKMTVFVGAALALVLASALGVLAGSLIAHNINEKHLHYAAGISFIGIGLWTRLKA